MFNIEDKEMIKKIINERDTDELVIPVYLRVGNNYYSLLEANEIDRCSPSIFKVGFGSSDSVFVRNKFPKSMLIGFQESRIFSEFDEEKQCQVDYFTFESSSFPGDNTTLGSSINKWYDILLEYVMKYAEENRKQRIRNTMEELS